MENEKLEGLRNMMKILKLLVVLLLLVSVKSATAQSSDADYVDRNALILNVCPHVKVNSFEFHALKDEYRVLKYKWSNAGDQSVTSFEIVTLKYDPFNEPLIGSRLVIPGHNSANFNPLKAGEEDGDGVYERKDARLYMAICYVRRVRLKDGTIWQVDDKTLLSELKKVAPSIQKAGSLSPEPEAENKAK
jgi:hypothetical protein